MDRATTGGFNASELAHGRFVESHSAGAVNKPSRIGKLKAKGKKKRKVHLGVAKVGDMSQAR